jgi:hypothetical protein
VKDEALSHLILFGESSLGYALSEYMAHYHGERPHQGTDNVVLMPVADHRPGRADPLRCRERLGGLLKYYDCDAT